MSETPLIREAKRLHQERIDRAQRVHRVREAARRRSAQERLRVDVAEAKRLGIPQDELLDLATRTIYG